MSKEDPAKQDGGTAGMRQRTAVNWGLDDRQVNPPPGEPRSPSDSLTGLVRRPSFEATGGTLPHSASPGSPKLWSTPSQSRRKMTPNRARPRRSREGEGEEEGSVASSDSRVDDGASTEGTGSLSAAPLAYGESLTLSMTARLRHLLALEAQQQGRARRSEPSTEPPRSPRAPRAPYAPGAVESSSRSSAQCGLSSAASSTPASGSTSASTSASASASGRVGWRRGDEEPWRLWQAALRESAHVQRTLLAAESRAHHLVNVDACRRTRREISVELAPETEAARQLCAMLPAANARARTRAWADRSRALSDLRESTGPKARCWHVDDGSAGTLQLSLATEALAQSTADARQRIERAEQMATRITSADDWMPGGPSPRRSRSAGRLRPGVAAAEAALAFEPHLLHSPTLSRQRRQAALVAEEQREWRQWQQRQREQRQMQRAAHSARPQPPQRSASAGPRLRPKAGGTD